MGAKQVEPLLAGDLTTLTATEYRAQFLWARETVPATERDGCVFPARIAWVLAQTTTEQLSACRSGDLEPFFEWEEAPEVREPRWARSPGRRARHA